MDYVIVCVEQETRPTPEPHDHIVAVGIGSGAYKTQTFSLIEVAELIDTQPFYVRAGDNQE